MIDMHSHFMYGIDDGPKLLNDSINILKKLKELGFQKVVATPHYIKDTIYNKNNKDKINCINNIKKVINSDSIDIDLYLGNEVYLNDNICDLIINKEVATINKSRYVLVEFPMNVQLNLMKDYLYDLKISGYIPILAHPERYTNFKKNIDELNGLYNDKILFQSNYGSILGQYGKDSKKLMKYLLINNMVSFLSTDSHSVNSKILNNFEKAKLKIIKIIGKDNFDKLSNHNIKKVLEDMDL